MNPEYYSRISLAHVPALRMAILFAVGIVLARLLEPGWELAALAAGIALLIRFLCYFLRKKRFQDAIVFTEYAGYGLAIVFFGTFLYSWHVWQHTSERPELVLTSAPASVTVWGTITSYRITESGGVSFQLEVDSAKTQAGHRFLHTFQSTGFVSRERMNQPFIYGDYVQFVGQLEQIQAPRNPNEFDFRRMMATRGIHVRFWVDEIVTVRPDQNRLGWNYWRTGVRHLLQQLFSSENEPLARAIILGDRTGLEREDQQAFSRAGLAHLMAVSGMHVGFLLFPIWFLLPWIWDTPRKRWTSFLGVIGLLYFYAGITGFTVSVLRASVMALLLFYGRIFRKKADSLNYLGVAMLVVLLISPAQLFQIGFQLSFGAVFVILIMLPVLRQSLPTKWRGTRVGGLYQAIMVSILVQAGLFPVLAWYFGEYSIIGPLSNTLAAFLVQVAFSWTLVMLLLGLIFPALAAFASTPVDYFFGILRYFVLHVAEWEYAWIAVSITNPIFFGVWILLFLFLASLHNPYLRWKLFALLLLSMCLHQVSSLWNSLKVPPLHIVAYDVGQGSATLIRTPSGAHALYDAGIWSPARNSGLATIVPDLQSRGITHLQAIILSHPHADHIGGVPDILQAVSVDTIYDAGFAYGSAIYQRILRMAQEKEIPIVTPSAGDVIWIGEVPFMVLSPHFKLTGNDPNTYSIVVKLRYGRTSFLLTGDATSQTERWLADVYGDFLKTDVLKVAHHGSNTSSTSRFLEKAEPQHAFVSLGFRNRYGHPHQEAVQRLHSYVPEVRYTSLQGAIKYRSDGKTVWHYEWR